MQAYFSTIKHYQKEDRIALHAYRKKLVLVLPLCSEVVFQRYTKLKMGDYFRDMTNSETYVYLMRYIKQTAIETANHIKEHVSSENFRLTNVIADQQLKIREMELRLAAVETMQKQLQQKERENTIVIFGLQVPCGEHLWRYTINKLQELLRIELDVSDINNVYIAQVGASIAIKVELARFLKKAMILKKAFKLKRTDVRIADEIFTRPSRKIYKCHSHPSPSTANENVPNNLQPKWMKVQNTTFYRSTSSDEMYWNCAFDTTVVTIVEHSSGTSVPSTSAAGNGAHE